MRPCEYYSCGNQAMIPQSPVSPFDRELPAPVDVKEVVTQVPTLPADVASEITGTAVGVVKFDVANYRNEDVLHRVIQIDGPVIALHDISDAYVFSAYKLFVRMGSNTRGKHSL